MSLSARRRLLLIIKPCIQEEQSIFIVTDRISRRRWVEECVWQNLFTGDLLPMVSLVADLQPALGWCTTKCQPLHGCLSKTSGLLPLGVEVELLHQAKELKHFRFLFTSDKQME